jgi:Phage Tail Collar Domain/Collagen triple helix repeat (20 copies)
MFRSAVSFVRRHVAVLVVAFLALAGTAYAVGGSSAGQSKTYYACATGQFHTLNLTTKSAKCPHGQQKIAFNAQGRPGRAGKAGAAGQAGASGPAGATGPQGPAGERGPSVFGSPGTKGDKGDTGDTGPAGAKGDTGDTGPAGAKGDTGDAGPAGAKGDTGDIGDTGAKGDTGVAGATGSAGLSALTATASEPAGANCAAGGIKITGGQDANHNSTLDPGEIDPAITRYVCNGAAGSSNADTLDGLDSSAFVTTSGFGQRFTSALGQKFFSGNRDTTLNGGAGIEDWLGEIFLTAASFPPPGTAFAAGQVLAISQYTALFSLLGTTYGGDGRTTFALPDLRDEAPAGTNYVITIDGLYPSRP